MSPTCSSRDEGVEVPVDRRGSRDVAAVASRIWASVSSDCRNQIFAFSGLLSVGDARSPNQ